MMKKYQERQSKRDEKGKKPCPAFGRCGGCQYLDIPYEKQLREKQNKVETLIGKYTTVHPIRGMEDPFHYRNKVHAVFGRRKDGTILSGTYQEGTRRLVNIDECLIDDPLADAIIREIRALVQSFGWKTYHEESGYGLFRHVLIRRAHATGQILVALVVTSPILPAKKHFLNALLEKYPQITTIVQNINPHRTGMVLGEREIVLYGKGYIEDELCSLTFRISSRSFYQVNSIQTEYLYGKAMELAALMGKETVIDAYCGIGTIGLIAAGKAASVVGVEINRDAVRDAISNAKVNKITNARFYEADAEEFMLDMAKEKETADVLFVDPPRAGCSTSFIRAALNLQPSRIVYISCNPETLARDLEQFAGAYQIRGAWPYDMFSQCDHIETVVLMSRKDT